jgi:MSHA biogenesis protein MshI
LFSLLAKSQRHGPRAGIMVHDRNAAVAAIQRRPGQRPAIEECAVISCEGDEQIGPLLRRVVSKFGLSRAKVFAVASPADYQLLQVEAPEVQPAELRAAMRWRLRDVIDFHIDDAVIDVFEIPDQSRRAQKMLFAVAARSAAVQHLVGALAPHARHFDVIDIPELCLRNVSALLPQDQKGVATLLLGERFAQLNLTRQGVLYLARRIEYKRGYDIEEKTEQSGQNIDAGVLALELQRSLDYFESHYDQAPIGDLVIAPGGEAAAHLAVRLRSETSLRIALLDIGEVMDGAEKIGTPSVECLLALGAALRNEATGI